MKVGRYGEALGILSQMELSRLDDCHYRASLARLARVLSESQVTWHVATSLLARGVSLAMALGRCSVAEAEGDQRYWDHWGQTVEAAREVRAAWDGFQRFCRDTASDPEELLRSCPERDAIDIVTDMAGSVIRREEQLVARQPRGSTEGMWTSSSVTPEGRVRDRMERGAAYAQILQGQWNPLLKKG